MGEYVLYRLGEKTHEFTRPMFDENGVIGDTGRVYKGNSKYQVEIDVSTSFGNKTLTKEFKNKSKAQRFEEKIEEIDGFPTLSLDESASPELISENRQES